MASRIADALPIVGGAIGLGLEVRPVPDCDIVVITTCSMPRDHVSAYGLASSKLDGNALTPALDALTAGGARMDDAWAASNFTSPPAR